MKLACRYAIVQFMPYPETGEFANVGVVLFCRERRFFDFKLTPRRGRITNFFAELDGKIVQAGLQAMTAELLRLRTLIDTGGLFRVEDDLAPRIFDDLVRPREALLRFGAPRVVLTDNPAAKLDELFEYYVGRTFVTKAYQEEIIERNIRATLKHAELLRQYEAAKVGNDDFQVRFPFVHKIADRAVKAIKPINLAQDDVTGILDHGGHWVARIRRLKQRQALPEALLFVAQTPPLAAHKRLNAFHEIKGELVQLGAEVVQADDKKAITDFARFTGKLH